VRSIFFSSFNVLRLDWQIEDYNEPFLSFLSDYDDGKDLSECDFNNDGLNFPYDDSNKRKLAYRHRAIANKYTKVLIVDTYGFMGLLF